MERISKEIKDINDDVWKLIEPLVKLPPDSRSSSSSVNSDKVTRLGLVLELLKDGYPRDFKKNLIRFFEGSMDAQYIAGKDLIFWIWLKFESIERRIKLIEDTINKDMKPRLESLEGIE
jgi:hypothetical protein